MLGPIIIVNDDECHSQVLGQNGAFLAKPIGQNNVIDVVDSVLTKSRSAGQPVSAHTEGAS
jgi:hypothetical protein